MKTKTPPPNEDAEMLVVMEYPGIARPRGRPPKNLAEEGGSPTVVKSVRLPVPVWEELERRAARLDMPPHQVMRIAIFAWLEHVRSDRPRRR